MPSFPRRSLLAALGSSLLWLGACTVPAPMTEYPPITFDAKPPLQLDVSEVAVELTYQAPGAAPHVDHLFPVRIAEAAQRWARDRLASAGTGFRARYTVRDASAVEVPLERSGGVKGLLTQEQSKRYDARVTVELGIFDSQGRQVASARAEAVRSRSVPEDITLNERDRVWYEMTKALMAELDKQLEQTIRTSLKPYLQP